MKTFDPAELRRTNRGITTVLFANSLPRVATYLPLARAIEAAGHTAFLLHPWTVQIPEDEVRAFGDVKTREVETDAIEDIEGVDVFFSSEVVQTATRGSSRVRIFHSLPDDGLFTNYAARVRRNPFLATTADYLAVAVRQSSRRWTAENYQIIPGELPELDHQRRGALDIVPAGYPKIEYLTHHIEALGPKKYLMYCPTSTGGAVGSRVLTHGRETLRMLLDQFPGYTIVFRPYPSADVQKLEKLRAEFAGHPRFGFDDTLTGIGYLRHAAMVVTDHSSVAVSFSIATGRPSVFFSDLTQKSSAEIDPLGYRTTTIEQVAASVRDGLATLDAWREKILKERSVHLYNAATASEYLAAKLPIFAAGGTDPEWLSIPREKLFTHASEVLASR